MEYVLAFSIIASGFIQGGYFPSVFLLAGIMLSIFCIKSSARKIQPAERILWLFSVVYVFSSFINGYNSASVAQACLPGVCACFLSCYLSLPDAKKKKLLLLVLAGNGLLAVIGMVAYSGIVSIPGSVVSKRLQFPFQYANTAGIWYAASAMLCQSSTEKFVKALLLPITTALFLTRSIGAVGLYLIIQCVRIFLLRKNDEVCIRVLLANIISAVYSLLLYFSSGIISIFILAVMCFSGWHLEKIIAQAPQIQLHWVCLPICGIGATAVALGRQRFLSGFGTLAERLNQMKDGCALISEHLLFGVGAGNWECYSPYYQSAQYTSTVIHSSVVQIGVDAGIFAVVLILVFFLLMWKSIGNCLEIKLPFLMLVLHSLGDFDLLFFPVCALILMVAFYNQKPENEPTKNIKLIISAGVFLSAFGVMLCCEQGVKQLIYKMNDQKLDAVIAQYEHERFLYGENREAKNCYINALYYTNYDEKVLEETECIEVLGTQELLLRAQSLRSLGDEDIACSMLLSELEKRSHQIVLFREVAKLLTEWQARKEYIDLYNQIAEKANYQRTILATLQGNQVDIDILDFT